MDVLKILVSVILLFWALGTIGKQMLRSLRVNDAPPALIPLVGWAGFVFLMLAIGPFSRFGVMAAGVIFFALAMLFTLLPLIRKNLAKSAPPIDALAAVLLAAPLLYGVAGIAPHAWDDFSQWLPNAYYLFKNGGFPTPETPVFSAWPVYPYGFSLLIAATGWLESRFVESAGPILNTGLLIIFTLFITHLSAASDARPITRLKIFAALFLGLILINPGFNQYLQFSSYSETPTAILLGVLLYLGAQIFKDNYRTPAILFALLALIFVQLRQANMFLLAILVISLSLAHINMLRARLKPLAFALIPAIVAVAIWYAYTRPFMAQQGFAVAPAWQWELFEPLLLAICEVMARKSGYFLLLLGTIGWGIWYAYKRDGNEKLIVSAALLTVGYTAFLILAYMGSTFSAQEISNAASFFRYMSHLNYAILLAILLTALPTIRKYQPIVQKYLPIAGWVCVALVPLAGAITSYQGWLPKPSAEITELRTFAKEILPALPEKAKTGVLLPTFDGLEASIIRYEWNLQNRPNSPLIADRFTRFDAENSFNATQAFAARFDAVIVGPDDTLAWLTLGHSSEKYWAAFVPTGSPQWKMLKRDMIKP